MNVKLERLSSSGIEEFRICLILAMPYVKMAIRDYVPLMVGTTSGSINFSVSGGGLMKKGFVFAIVILLSISAYAREEEHPITGCREEEKREVKAMEYYVAVDGNDEYSGSMDQPFRTIQKAADVMVAGDTCVVREGTYRETVRPKNTGSEGKPIRFIAAPGEIVVLRGTEPVTGDWSVHKGSIFKTQVAATFEQLFVDDDMMIEARWPKARFEELLDRSKWAKTNVGSRYGKIVDPELAKTNIDWTGAIATLNVAHQFYSWTRAVVKHEKGSDTFKYSKDLPGITHFADKTTPWEHNVYFLSGKLEALNSPTEWFLDTDTGTVYLWAPDGGNPGTHEVEVKVRDYGFDVQGVDYIEVRGFHFFGCTFQFRECSFCVVDGCHLRFPTYSRWLTDFSVKSKSTTSTMMRGAHNTVKNSSLVYSTTSGITMQGSHNTVENCLVHELCWNGSLRYVGIQMGPGGASGDDASQIEGKCVLRQSTVLNTGNACVSVGGMPDNVVEYNHIYSGGRACKDVSLLYTHLPVIAGTVFRYNWVHDCHAPHIALGIRGDDQTRGLTVVYNVVWNCDWEGIVVKGDNNQVHHNTCFNNELMDIRLDNVPEPRKPWRKQWPLLEKQNQHSEAYNNCAADIRGWRSKDYVPPGGKAENNFGGEDPMLIAPEHFDFRPKAGSPLIDAGRIIPGFTEDYKDNAPDIGAYEYGGEHWIAGYQNSLWVSAEEFNLDEKEAACVKVALAMPPLEPVHVKVTAEGTVIASDVELTFAPENWMQPQVVSVTVQKDAGAARGKIRLQAEGIDPVEIFVKK